MFTCTFKSWMSLVEKSEGRFIRKEEKKEGRRETRKGGRKERGKEKIKFLLIKLIFKWEIGHQLHVG